jgi:tetratricopeptide (TPR) repeat protein
MYRAQWQKCIDTLKNYLPLPTAVWKEERCAAMRWIAKSFGMLSQNTDAYGWYYRAIAEVPYMREPYVECAQMAYRLSDWPVCFCMAEEALKIKQKSSCYINMGYAWDYTPDDLCAIASYRLGMYERSAAHARAALTFSPDDERLKNNLKLIEAMLPKE